MGENEVDNEDEQHVVSPHCLGRRFVILIDQREKKRAHNTSMEDG